jgi:hypothetical protein
MINLQNERSFEKEREAFLWGFIGDNRTGKSVTALQMAREWREAKPFGTIIAHDPQGRFKDITDFYIPTGMKGWAEMCADQTDALIILDELRLLHPSPRADDGLLKLMANRGEHNIDIIYIVHNPALVLETLTYFTGMYFMFYTNSKIGGFQKKIPNYTLAHSASIYINKYVKTYGKGEYPSFPYIAVDTVTEELYAMNMNQEYVLNLK